MWNSPGMMSISTRRGLGREGEDNESLRSFRITNEIERLDTEKAERIEIARTETNAIAWLKLLIISLLITIGAVMAWLTFTLTRQQEQMDFVNAFEFQSSRLIETFQQRMVYFLFTGVGIAVSMGETSKKVTLGDFPNITWPAFEPMIDGSVQISQAVSLSWAPFVKDENEREQWEEYIVSGQTFVDYSGSDNPSAQDIDAEWEGQNAEDGIFELYNGLWPVRSDSVGPYSPIWQSTPISETRKSVLLDQFSEPIRAAALRRMNETGLSVFSGFLDQEFESKITKSYDGVQSVLFTPFYQNLAIVGSFQIVFDWSTVFATEGDDISSVWVILENTCGDVASFFITGREVKYQGEGDYHDTQGLDYGQRYERSSSLEGMKEFWLSRFDQDRLTASILNAYFDSDPLEIDNTCWYTIRVYPSREFSSKFTTMQPMIYTFAVCCGFMVCVLLVWIYSRLVERRQSKILTQAVEARSIVDSMFPSAFREKLFRNRRQERQQDSTGFFAKVAPPKILLTMMLTRTDSVTETNEDSPFLQEPIAEMFSNTTVIFADIAGFTAWSSEREPSQVFELLETVYRQFDLVAKRLGVFKVETIGDCYVAVTGLPEANKDHAIVCARFAGEVLQQMKHLTTSLEVSLGPGTSDLALRVGLHSGSVTAGVLRGEKARFQLFGDTMNVASRMESTGLAGRIQISAETAGLLIASGKERWLQKREGLVAVKGKGEMQTYWLTPQRGSRTSSMNQNPGVLNSSSADGDNRNSRHWKELGLDAPLPLIHNKKERLIDWNVEVLISRLAMVVAKRNKQALVGEVAYKGRGYDRRNGHPLNEVTEVIHLPRFDPRVARRASLDKSPNTINEAVRAQLRDYVARIASCYKDVPFHNFEHASHVALSANKLIKRIIAPEDVDYNKDGSNKCERMESLASDLHASTFGISSDPLSHFVVVLAALVHDVDHTGVPNAQLVKERDPIALRYENKSVAEQHSVQLALVTLAEPQYRDLQNCIYANEYEEDRFRQLVINSVMATDIVDRDLHTLRKNRWEKAFSRSNSSRTLEEDVNRKATIVIEHIIQASDVAHTMQHWHVYCKWNEKLYQEMYNAYLCGRSDQDPTTGWYENEIGFLDNYIIPLAKKLKECGVFGVSSDEYLTYALANRQEWAIKGRQVTREMVIRRMNHFGQTKPSGQVRTNHPNRRNSMNNCISSARSTDSVEEVVVARGRDPVLTSSPNRGSGRSDIIV